MIISYLFLKGLYVGEHFDASLHQPETSCIESGFTQLQYPHGNPEQVLIQLCVLIKIDNR